MKIRKVVVAVMILTLLATGIIGSTDTVKAEGGMDEPKLELSEGSFKMVVKPGEASHVRVPITSLNSIMFNTNASIVKDSSLPFTFTKPTILTSYDTPSTNILTDDTVYVEFDIKVKDNAHIGTYPVTINISGQNLTGGSISANIDIEFAILEEKIPAMLTVSNVKLDNPVPGVDTELSFTVKNEGEIIARNIFIDEIVFGESKINKRYTSSDIKIGDLEPGDDYTVTLPVFIDPMAEQGVKNLTAIFKFKDNDGGIDGGIEPYTSENTFSIKISENKNKPLIDISSIKNKGELKPGNEFEVIAVLNNYGGSRAVNVNVSIDKSSISTDCFMENFYTDEIYVGDIKKGANKEVAIPLIISEIASGGNKILQININYQDEYGVEYSRSKTIYPEIIGTLTDTSDEPNLIISEVKQSPNMPQAGDNMKVSFVLENKGEVDISEIKIIAGTSSDTFIPVDSEPYQYIELLRGYEKKTITIPLKLSESIPEELNELTIDISYKGGKEPVTTIPILNVINDLQEESITKPKLMISNYTFDVDELRAGDTFNFTFDLYNTNSQVAAKNMRVTLTQDENMFSVTQGSNSFFIDKLDPGETVSKTIEMKVKSDAITKPYPLKIMMDYEYDGVKPNPTTGDIDESEEVIELNLLVIENSRPVVDYVQLYSYDGMVSVGNPAFLSFEFYNMGKSALNNVVATVEGDYTSAGGDMYYIGNVISGDRHYGEFEVIPNIEGMAMGTIRITFEDSNGEEVEYTKEFEQYIEAAQVWDPGMEGEHEGVFNPITPEPKKEILKPWMYILINIGIFILFVPITRAIIIAVHKKKLRKKEDLEY